MKQTAIRRSDLLVALQELVEALDKRKPHLERAGEAQILADARRLRANAMKRIACLRERDSDEGGAGLSDERGKETTR